MWGPPASRTWARLDHYESPRVPKALLTMLDDEDTSVQHARAAALGAGRVRLLIADELQATRRTVLMALAGSPHGTHRRVDPTLVPRLHAERDPQLRSRIVRSLGQTCRQRTNDGAAEPRRPYSPLTIRSPNSLSQPAWTFWRTTTETCALAVASLEVIGRMPQPPSSN